MKIKRVVKKSSWLINQLVSISGSIASALLRKGKKPLKVNAGDIILLEIKKREVLYD